MWVLITARLAAERSFQVELSTRGILLDRLLYLSSRRKCAMRRIRKLREGKGQCSKTKDGKGAEKGVSKDTTSKET
jgi:hypothetical protein